jgi:arylsulfatase A-like enzyme
MEGILDDTIICFISDHGDMLGNHYMAAKRVFYQSAANIPMILLGTKSNPPLPEGSVEDRLVGLQDVMPTLLELCDIPVPDSVDGISMVGSQRREYLYGECGEDELATRMIRTDRFKLIYYSTGNVFQLFDMHKDPQELHNLAAEAEHQDTLRQLTGMLKSELYGSDEAWLQNGELVGKPDQPYHWAPHRNLNSQRGDGWPPSPMVDIPQVEWTPQRK